MIKPKLTLCDIDGTLLNSKQELLPEIVEAIQHYVNSGGIFCLASARPAYGMIFLAKIIGLDVPLITLNGAYIIDPSKTNTVLFQQPLLKQSVKQIIQLIKINHLNISINCYAGLNWYIEKPNKWSSQESSIVDFKPEIINFDQIYNQKNIHKILCMGKPEEISELNSLIFENSKLQIIATRSKKTYLEITDNKVSKVSALKHLASYFKISLDQTMGIGDGDNDIEMIKTAGIGIALANASKNLLQAADFIVKDNDHAGVAEALKKYTNLE